MCSRNGGSFRPSFATVQGTCSFGPLEMDLTILTITNTPIFLNSSLMNMYAYMSTAQKVYIPEHARLQWL